MFLLKKVFQVRDKAAKKAGRMAHDQEKPFLEHLEDLRRMFMRIIITVMIAMVGCFVFNKELMDIIRYPVKLAGLAQGDPFHLPDAIPRERWNDAEKIVMAARDAAPGFRDHYVAAAVGEDPELGDLVEAYGIFQMAATLDGTRREQFVDDAVTGRDGVRAKVDILLRSNPNADPKGERSLIRMSTLKPAESFTLSIKLALYAGLIVCFPFLLYFVGEFVLPGLHSHEKRLLLPSLLVGFGLFLFGVLFCYYVVTPRALAFFHQFGEELGMESDWRIGYYIGFVTQLILLFGLCFELPVVIMALVKLEILSYETMRNSRSYAIVIIFFVSALITPTVDVLTLVLLAGPMVILYEICIWIAYFLNRRELRREESERAERAERRARLAAAHPGGTNPDSNPEDEPHTTEHEHGSPHPEGPRHDHDPHHDDPHGHDPYHDPYHDDAHGHDPYHDHYHHDPDPDHPHDPSAGPDADPADPWHHYGGHEPATEARSEPSGPTAPDPTEDEDDPYHGAGDPNAHYMGELKPRPSVDVEGTSPTAEASADETDAGLSVDAPTPSDSPSHPDEAGHGQHNGEGDPGSAADSDGGSDTSRGEDDPPDDKHP